MSDIVDRDGNKTIIIAVVPTEKRYICRTVEELMRVFEKYSHVKMLFDKEVNNGKDNG